MYYDQHVHSNNSHDGKYSVLEMVNGAIENGALGITITEHLDINKKTGEYSTEHIKNCQLEIETLKEQLPPRFYLGFGAEMGRSIDHLNKANRVLNTFSFDVVLASVHNLLNCSDFCCKDGICENPQQEMNAYLLSVLKTAQMCDFDVLAHLTYPWRYFEWNESFPKIDEFRDITDEILKTLIKRDKALEVNISGLVRIPEFNVMPPKNILQRYKELKGELITIGTDAHVKEQCGQKLKEGIEILKVAGFNQMALYQNRQPQFIKLL